MTASLFDVATSHEQLVGEFVRVEIDRRGWTMTEAIDELTMLPSVMDRLLTGRLAGEFRAKQYAKVERGLGLPPGLLAQIADGDLTGLELRGNLDLTRKAQLVRAMKRLGH